MWLAELDTGKATFRATAPTPAEAWEMLNLLVCQKMGMSLKALRQFPVGPRW